MNEATNEATNEASRKMQNSVRPLNEGDLDRVIAIDRAHSGVPRRHFYAKRFAAAAARPDEFIQLGVVHGGVLHGFAIARVFSGEFGRESKIAMLDAVGVGTEVQERGVGHELMAALVAAMREAGVMKLQSQAAWTNHPLLRFFDASGFTLADRTVLERSVAAPFAERNEEE
jgi:GNAT superfamily N-acetyltransferase